MNIAPLISSSAAALGYGVWAMIANMEHGLNMQIRAGIVQAVSSFTITLCLTLFAIYIYNLVGKGGAGVVVGALTSMIPLVVIPFAAHYYFGTANIIPTILPGLIIGSIYLWSYLIIHRRKTDF